MKHLADYVKKQACTVYSPDSMGEDSEHLDSQLAKIDLIPIRNGKAHIRYPMHTTQQVYLVLHLEGTKSEGKHPCRHSFDTIHRELAQLFHECGAGEVPIPCLHQWRADEWERDEIHRFDETLGENNHYQQPRLEQQKYRRTAGEALLVYPIPINKIEQLSKVMERIAIEQKEKAAVAAPAMMQ